MSRTHPNPIATPIQQILDLFSGELSGVRFPGLEDSVLDGAAARAKRAAEAVAEAEQLLELARSELTEAQEELLQKAHRALAYVRIYAEDNEALFAVIDSIVLPRSTRRSAATSKPTASTPLPAPELPSPRRRRAARVSEAPDLFEESGVQAQTA